MYVTRQMFSIALYVNFALWMRHYCLALSIFVVQSAELSSQYCMVASGVKCASVAYLCVDVRTIAIWTSSPDVDDLSRTKGLFAFRVHAMVCVRVSILSCVIGFLVPFMAICWPDFFSLVYMSISSLKRFYDEYCCCHFLVFDSAPVRTVADEWAGYLTYESRVSTYSNQLEQKKAIRVRFLDNSNMTGCRLKFVYPPL